MSRKRKQSPAEDEYSFEIDPEPLEESVTALGGLPLLLRAIRSLDVPGSVKRNLRVKKRERGFDEPTYVESLPVLNAVGGDCPEDFDRLPEGPVVAGMLGHAVPGMVESRTLPCQFHDETKIEQAQRELALDRVSDIPEESDPLRGLAQVNQDVVQELGRRCADRKIATIELNGTIIESWKKQANKTFEGSSGYQPLLALWAEMNVVVADEFRDWNVPAQRAQLPATERAFQAWPSTVKELCFRGDSASYEESLLSWPRNEERPRVRPASLDLPTARA